MSDKPEPHQFPEFAPSGDGSAEDEQDYQKRVKAFYAALFTDAKRLEIEAVTALKRQALRAGG